MRQDKTTHPSDINIHTIDTNIVVKVIFLIYILQLQQ